MQKKIHIQAKTNDRKVRRFGNILAPLSRENKKLINENNRLLSGSKTIASLTCKLNFETCNMFLICAQEKQLTLINSSLSKIQCSRCHLVPFNVITIQLTSLQTASTHQLTIITLNRYLGQYYSCVA